MISAVRNEAPAKCNFQEFLFKVLCFLSWQAMSEFVPRITRWHYADPDTLKVKTKVKCQQ